jgi:hypothetical protein
VLSLLPRTNADSAATSADADADAVADATTCSEALAPASAIPFDRIRQKARRGNAQRARWVVAPIIIVPISPL